MKTLLWKEYRQNRKVLLALGIFLSLPYVIALFIGVVERARYYGEYDFAPYTSWSVLLYMASFLSLGLLVLACAFVSGNMVAGERVDRSAEFAAYLPISRRSAITSKAIFAIGACLAVVLVNAAVAYTATHVGGGTWPSRSPREAASIELVAAVTATLIFGVSWLMSTVISTPGNAAASGILAAILVPGTLGLIDYARGLEEAPTLEHWYIPTCLILGISCFVAGVVYYVRRVEP